MLDALLGLGQLVFMAAAVGVGLFLFILLTLVVFGTIGYELSQRVFNA